MNSYEFSLWQEVLLEKGASVLGDLFRLKRYGLVWSAEQDILMSQTESELDQIKGQFNLVNNFVSKIGGDTDL